MKVLFKVALFLAAAVSLSSCGEKIESGAGGSTVSVPDLVVSFDKSVIKCDGNDVVTFKAFYKNEEISDVAEFYRLDKNQYLPMSSRTFATDVAGEYRFQVAYGTSKSEIVKITAISRDIPMAPADPASGSTSFVHRAFFNQHTGTQCPNCPFMTYLLKQSLVDGYEGKVVLASVRNYSGESGFANIPNPASSWPYLHIDYSDNFPYNGSVASLHSKIDEIVSAPAKVGISAAPMYYEDGQIIVKVAVKAAETDEYNVGLWLMQDNFKKTQTVATDRVHLLGPDGFNDSYHIHNNCVRVAESKYLGAHVGYPLGRIEKGKTSEWVFIVNVNLGAGKDLDGDGDIDHNDGSWWEGRSKINLSDLRFTAFVTTHQGTSYQVVNAIEFLYNQPKAFEYIK